MSQLFSNESALRIRWPKYWNFSFSISPSNNYSGWMDSYSLLRGILLTQGLNSGLLHFRWILYQLSHQGSPLR